MSSPKLPVWLMVLLTADRSFARDLNLDQFVAAIAGDREERDLITRVLFAPPHDAVAVRYRQEVFQDLEIPALLGSPSGFPGSSARYAPTCASRRRCRSGTSGRAELRGRAVLPARRMARGDRTLSVGGEEHVHGGVRDAVELVFGRERVRAAEHDLVHRLVHDEPGELIGG